MHCPRRLTLHHHAQYAVDARLVALAMTLEPIEHVLIQTNGQLLFRRRPGHGGLFEKGLVEPRNVRIVNIGILHTVTPCQVTLDSFSIHGASGELGVNSTPPSASLRAGSVAKGAARTGHP